VAWGEIGKDPIHQAKGFGHFSLEESQSSWVVKQERQVRYRHQPHVERISWGTEYVITLWILEPW
jgi:hypothetical protein